MAENITDDNNETGLDAADIALAAMQGLMAGGNPPEWAAKMAWHCVAPFIEGMQEYSSLVAKMQQGQAEHSAKMAAQSQQG